MRQQFNGLVRGLLARLTGWKQAWLLLAAMWVLGAIAVAVIVQFQGRVDHGRRAQVVIGQMRIQQSAVVSLAFARATSVSVSPLTPLQTTAAIDGSQAAFNRSEAKLADLDESSAPRQLRPLSDRYFQFTALLAALVGAGKAEQAALLFGKSERRGGASASLTAELDRADTSYGADAARSRIATTVGTVSAVAFLLIAFSIAFAFSLRARRRSHHDATTDALSGLGNRRKLFADMEQRIASLKTSETVSVGIFDLDGFKAYNDTFGHPAGDALLARVGARLAAVIAGKGEAYRIGGDEFVVIAAGIPNGKELLSAARAALSERGESFSVGCSFGSTAIHAGITLEQALHIADQRLYTNKRARRTVLGTEIKDVLLQVLAEQDESLVAHVGHVARLATNLAVELGLVPDEIELTRLTAELHDIGKSAIPSAILGKHGSLDHDERKFMQRHTAIGERIVAASPALTRVAPLVRATHEHWNGAGYPDGLRELEIPLSSRIVAVVDAYDAMTGDRPYRTRLSSDDAIVELRRCAGAQFDPTITRAFIAMCQKTADRLIAIPRLSAT